MSFPEIIGAIIIGPLKLVFEIIFNLANKFTQNPGLSIIALSLAMNILVLPLYRRADAMQEEARDIDAKLRKGINHIKKSFSGDERMMILQTYYRQNNYRPTDALKGSVSLLLEIPFFIAAYQFLSHLSLLEGVSFGPIVNLAKPDGLLAIGGMAVNLLPILMTLINVLSSAIYLKGFPLKTKIQLYGMAGFFLVFLYNSPAGLVFYWTLNNVFSLVKTIFYKIKNPGKVLAILCSALGAAAFVFGLFVYEAETMTKKLFILMMAVVLELPLLLPIIKKLLPERKVIKELRPNRKLFVLAGLFITVLLGALIPSTFISASTQEFIDPDYFHNPIWYVVNTSCVAAGVFLLWFGVFYWLANTKGKKLFEALMLVLCGAMLVNYMFFGTKLGIIAEQLQYEAGVYFSTRETVINLAVMAAVAIIMLLLLKNAKLADFVLLTATAALLIMSVSQSVSINREAKELRAYTHNTQQQEQISFSLSKTGKNVVVIMLDRAKGEYLPYIFSEKPELEEKFDGFTYYSNVISYGRSTNFGAPGFYGGYEYTPVEMNRRADESLKDKHNEALKVMPVLFSENGFEVTVSDPVYANYNWVPDTSIFDEYPEILAFNSEGKFDGEEIEERIISDVKRNFFLLSLMKSSPVPIQRLIYDRGAYNDPGEISVQIEQSQYTARGSDHLFMAAYNVMKKLPELTEIREDEANTVLIMSNTTAHEPVMLQMPDYEPAITVDNWAWADVMGGQEINGEKLRFDTYLRTATYHSNMAAYLLIADWLDYLRENDVYDNTRIIIAADHGYELQQLEYFRDSNDGITTVDAYFPLLLVKDFNAKGFSTSDKFMTNADVPWLAMEGLIDNPVNPFTGKEINDAEKYAHDQFICMSEAWSVSMHSGNTFTASKWASVKENIWDKSNWTFSTEEAVLTEYVLP